MVFKTDDEIRILHVDEDHDSLEAVEKFFEDSEGDDLDFTVSGLDEPETAVDTARQVEADAVVSEFHYDSADIDGLTVLEDVEEELEIPLIFYSDSSWIDTGPDAVKKGAYDFITKGDGALDMLGAKVEQAVEQSRREDRLERNKERLGDFVSHVSHDLRNPLAITRTYNEEIKIKLDALSRVVEQYEDLDEVDEDVFHEAIADLEEYQETIEGSTERMESIIDDALTYARVGGSVDETDELDIQAISRSCWENLETYNGELDTQFYGPKLVDADRSRLTTLFENLYRNSFDHVGEDATIEVGPITQPIGTSTRARDEPTGFYIQDDGPGIPEEDRDEVLKEGYTTSRDGTGFGLSIVQQVIEAHDWDIDIDESPYGGARFEIYTD